jgi:hypothetical protein
MKRNALVMCVAALLATTAIAQSKPDGKSSKPSVAGPGTQTEDDLYVGTRAKPKDKAQTPRAGAASKEPDAAARSAEAAVYRRKAQETEPPRAQ